MHKCNFPGCTYKTNLKSKIDYHHVLPKELDSRSSNKQTIALCKNHHAHIFHPDVKYGQHSIKSDESLIILGIYQSTKGKSINYQRMDGTHFFYFPDSGDIWN